MTFCEFLEAVVRLSYSSLILSENVGNEETPKDIRVEIDANDVAGAIPKIVELLNSTLIETKKKKKTDGGIQKRSSTVSK